MLLLLRLCLGRPRFPSKPMPLHKSVDNLQTEPLCRLMGWQSVSQSLFTQSPEEDEEEEEELQLFVEVRHHPPFLRPAYLCGLPNRPSTDDGDSIVSEGAKRGAGGGRDRESKWTVR